MLFASICPYFLFIVWVYNCRHLATVRLHASQPTCLRCFVSTSICATQQKWLVRVVNSQPFSVVHDVRCPCCLLSSVQVVFFLLFMLSSVQVVFFLLFMLSSVFCPSCLLSSVLLVFFPLSGLSSSLCLGCLLLSVQVVFFLLS